MNFEANRKRILDDLKKQRDRKKVSAAKPVMHYTEGGAAKSADKQFVAIFAQKSLFVNNIVASLSQQFKVEVFFDVDKTTDYVLENRVKFVIVDIDPPSDYHQAANLLTVIKTLAAGVIFFVCTKDKDDSRAKALFSHGAFIVQKPVSIPELVELMSGHE